VGFLPSSSDLAAFGSGVPVQGFLPSTKRYLLVTGPCLLAVRLGSAHRLSPAATVLRLDFEAFFLAEVARLARCYPAFGVLPLLRFPPLGSFPVRCPSSLAAFRVHSWRCRVGLRRTMAVHGRLQRVAPLGGGSSSPTCPPTRGSKPFAFLRRRLGLLRFDRRCGNRAARHTGHTAPASLGRYAPLHRVQGDGHGLALPCGGPRLSCSWVLWEPCVPADLAHRLLPSRVAADPQRLRPGPRFRARARLIRPNVHRSHVGETGLQLL
jgi:hypothetical protein